MLFPLSTTVRHPCIGASVQAPSGGDNDYFGSSLVFSGSTLAVGAPHEGSCSTVIRSSPASDNGCVNAGAVYTFSLLRFFFGDLWTIQSYVKARVPPHVQCTMLSCTWVCEVR